LPDGSGQFILDTFRSEEILADFSNLEEIPMAFLQTKKKGTEG
jgi:hypothetical protein